jgi:hypothetical protein
MIKYCRLRLVPACICIILLVVIAAATLNAATNSHSKMLRFQVSQRVNADFSTVNGSSAKLTRGESVIWMRVNTTQLPAGAYTNWWVIFNNPAACSGGCGPDDFANEAVKGSVLFATGGIVGPDGVGHFEAHLEEGVLPVGDGKVFFGPGLLDAQHAEIHYVVRYHGPVSTNPVILQKQIGTSFGGCMPFLPDFPPDPVPEHQIYACYDPQGTMLPLP